MMITDTGSLESARSLSMNTRITSPNTHGYHETVIPRTTYEGKIAAALGRAPIVALLGAPRRRTRLTRGT